MAKDFKKEAERESEQHSAMYRWVQARTAALRDAVTAQDVLRRNGVRLKYDDREEQFSCPFHGKGDKTPSARCYPASVRGPSHAWCFVCQERWDAIGLWRKFNGGGEETKFTATLGQMERAYGIVAPDRPPLELDDEEDPEITKTKALFEACESRLLRARKAFDDNMKGFLSLGSILDRLLYQFEERRISPETAMKVLDQVLAKISAKVSICLAD